MSRLHLSGGLVLAAFISPSAALGDAAVEELAAAVRRESAVLIADPVILEALRTADRDRAGHDAARLSALDAQWRQEVSAGGGPLVAGLLAAPASDRLRARRQASGGQIADLFIFDRRGLNVAQTWMTNDFWQGDEPQFRMTVGRGAGAANVESVEPANPLYDGPVRAASTTLSDPATGNVIGGITVVFRVASALP